MVFRSSDARNFWPYWAYRVITCEGIDFQISERVAKFALRGTRANKTRSMHFTVNGRILEVGPRQERIRSTKIYWEERQSTGCESIARESRPAKLEESSDIESAASDMENVALGPDSRHKEITCAFRIASSDDRETSAFCDVA